MYILLFGQNESQMTWSSSEKPNLYPYISLAVKVEMRGAVVVVRRVPNSDLMKIPPRGRLPDHDTKVHPTHIDMTIF